MLRTTKILSYSRFAISEGVDKGAIFSGTGLNIDLLEERDTLIGFNDARRILNNLATHSPPDLALRFGSGTRQIDMGIVGHAMLSCSDMRQITAMWVKYSEVIGFPLRFKSLTTASQWTLEFIPVFQMSPHALQFCLEDAISCFLPLLREVAHSTPDKVDIELSIPQPANASLYNKYVKAPVRFGAARSGFTTDVAFLNTKIAGGDAEMLAICDANCSAILQNLHGSGSAVQRVRDVLLTCRGDIPLIEDVAAQLGYSKRTLNRRLAEEGYSYQALVSDFRRDYAFQLLSEETLQIKQVAHVLGFKDPNSFRRAFKQWTGLPAKQWQENYSVLNR